MISKAPFERALSIGPLGAVMSYKVTGFWSYEQIRVEFEPVPDPSQGIVYMIYVSHSSGGRDNNINDVEAAKNFALAYTDAANLAEEMQNSDFLQTSLMDGIQKELTKWQNS